MEEIRFNLAAPDLLCICVDDRQHGENSGRLYCCYSREAMYFAHEYQLIKIIERDFVGKRSPVLTRKIIRKFIIDCLIKRKLYVTMKRK